MNIRSLACGCVQDCGYTMRHTPEKGEYLFLFLKSPARLLTSAGEVNVPAGAAVLLDDSCDWGYGAAEGALVCDWICFDAGGDREFMESLGLVCGVPAEFADGGFICGLIRNIGEEFYSLSARRVKMLDQLMRTLLIAYSDTGKRRDLSQSASDPHYTALTELRAKIYRNPQLKWNVDAMAADVNMSRSYFQHIYREFFGVSCIADVINGKVEKAKEILSETSCTVSQVAAMCGYDNEEHFMRQFKKTVGVTPTRFRKDLR